MTRRKDKTMTMGFVTHLPAIPPAAPPSRGKTFAGRGPSGILDESKITSKGQLTLPKTVRTALGAAEGDTVRFVMEGGKVVVEVAPQDPLDDPALAAFLDVLEESISAATDFPAELMNTMKALTDGIEVDLDAPIEGDVVI